MRSLRISSSIELITCFIAQLAKLYGVGLLIMPFRYVYSIQSFKCLAQSGGMYAIVFVPGSLYGWSRFNLLTSLSTSLSSSGVISSNGLVGFIVIRACTLFLHVQKSIVVCPQNTTISSMGVVIILVRAVFGVYSLLIDSGHRRG